MVKLKKVNELVHSILIEYPETRNSDAELYCRVAQYVEKETGRSILDNYFGYVMCHLKEYKLPSFKSVERARRKVQEHYPHLASDKKVKQMREEKEDEYRKYSKGIY